MSASGHRARLALFVLAVAFVLGLVRALDLEQWADLERLRGFIESHGTLAPIVFVAVCIGGIVLHLPEIVLIAVGGMVFGAARGFAYGWIGAILGSTLVFLAVRHGAGHAVSGVLGRRFERFRRLESRFVTHGFQMVLLLRLLLFLSPPLNWAIGATRVSLRAYVAGTAVGIVPGVAGTVLLADSFVEAETWGDLATPEVLLTLTAVVAVAIAGAAFARRALRQAEAAVATVASPDQGPSSS
ncbi:MAG: TVP38/TMEM64 family protein [Alphaproteobacteria bacterium]